MQKSHIFCDLSLWAKAAWGAPNRRGQIHVKRACIKQQTGGQPLAGSPSARTPRCGQHACTCCPILPPILLLLLATKSVCFAEIYGLERRWPRQIQFLCPGPRVYNLFLIERQLSFAGCPINLCGIKESRSWGSAVELICKRFAFKMSLSVGRRLKPLCFCYLYMAISPGMYTHVLYSWYLDNTSDSAVRIVQLNNQIEWPQLSVCVGIRVDLLARPKPQSGFGHNSKRATWTTNIC